jgi:hypothetical protein
VSINERIRDRQQSSPGCAAVQIERMGQLFPGTLGIAEDFLILSKYRSLQEAKGS